MLRGYVSESHHLYQQAASAQVNDTNRQQLSYFGYLSSYNAQTGYGTVLNVTAGASGVGTAGTGTAPGSLMDAAEATLGTGTAQAQAQQEPAAAKATKPAGKKKPALFGGDA